MSIQTTPTGLSSTPPQRLLEESLFHTWITQLRRQPEPPIKHGHVRPIMKGLIRIYSKGTDIRAVQRKGV